MIAQNSLHIKLIDRHMIAAHRPAAPIASRSSLKQLLIPRLNTVKAFLVNTCATPRRSTLILGSWIRQLLLIAALRGQLLPAKSSRLWPEEVVATIHDPACTCLNRWVVKQAGL